MYYVYVLLSLKDNKFYTGYTNDLKNRKKQHDNGLVFSTKTRRPLQLIYYEVCYNKQDAKAREKYLKSGMGKRYINNRLKNHLKSIKISNGDEIN
ncbi:GIY-YIG nuclease family protein [Patescibacteria group bacterium]|nr:GIY-YIG nuclease family protein [Patescibacteria group bacterium]